MKPYLSKEGNITSYLLSDDGNFPNNDELPLIYYNQCLEWEDDDGQSLEVLFKQHGWPTAWRDDIFDYHHYHSTAHELLGVYSGNARVQLGGPTGIMLEISKGDALVIPAGVAHKSLDKSEDFICIGAYPDGQSYDMNYGRLEERPEADRNIAKVSFPIADPIYGKNGPLLQYWKNKDL